MQRISGYGWFALACAVLLTWQAAAGTTVRQLLEYAPAPVDNPLKGLVPYAGDKRDLFPHSLEFNYLPLSALVIGLAAGLVCSFAIALKFRFGFDDALDVVGVHLVGGLLGSLLLGLFATKAVNPAVTSQGALMGGGSWNLMGEQLLAVGATLVWSFVLTIVIIKFLDKVMPGGVRVSAEDEEMGLDLTQHSEVGYSLDRV